MGRPKISIEREELKGLYIHKKQSPRELAKHFGCNRQTIINRLREYELAVRTKGEGTALAKTTHHRADFSESLVEKAYLIGFRIGDLTVDMANPGGQTIRVSCASTRPEQIELIKQLFMPYGHIVLNGPYKNGRVSIQCLINTTFAFLLPKNDDIPDWILHDRDTFLSFLGGYSDAEAHFGISGTKQVFAYPQQIKRSFQSYRTNCLSLTYRDRSHIFGYPKGRGTCKVWSQRKIYGDLEFIAQIVFLDYCKCSYLVLSIPNVRGMHKGCWNSWRPIDEHAFYIVP